MLRVSLLLGLVYLISELLLTYSTSSRHGGQAKAGSDAPLAQPHRDEAGSEYVARQSGMGTSHSSTSKPLSVSHTMCRLRSKVYPRLRQAKIAIGKVTIINSAVAIRVDEDSTS